MNQPTTSAMMSSHLSHFSLHGRTALVTGSSRGIGRSILQALAGAGAEVIAHGVRSPVDAPGTGEVGTFYVQGDLSQSGGGVAVAKAALACGARPVDIVVLNASIQIRSPWREITTEDAVRQMQANFHSSLEILQGLVPGMESRGWGRILTIGSVQQDRPHPDMAVYAASKCAQSSLARNLAKQLGPAGITVNNLAPGIIETDRNTDALTNKTYVETLLQNIPVGHFGQPVDCAGTALLLCSEAGRYITGQDICVDGGFSL